MASIKNMIVYVEGNIGTGKSTFIKLCENYMRNIEDKGRFIPILIQEPVDEWLNTVDSDNKNILEKFYEDQHRWSFTFQMNSFISRAHKISEAIKSNKTDKELLLFVERSIYTDRYCFARNCFETGKMSKMEYDIYCRWNDWLSKEFNLRPSGYIYLRCSPEENVIRISQRSREGECGIPLEYLTCLHNLHDSWMGKEKETIPVLTIDAMKYFIDPKIMDPIADDIIEFVHDL